MDGNQITVVEIKGIYQFHTSSKYGVLASQVAPCVATFFW